MSAKEHRQNSTDLAAIAERLLNAAREFGATAADAVLVRGTELEVGVRQGEVEKVKHAQQKHLGLRVFVGEQSATGSSSDFAAASLRELAERTVALARHCAADPFAGLPSPEELARELPDLDLFDPQLADVDAERALAWARTVEQAALGADPRIRNSEGAECAVHTAEVYYASTAGFAGGYSSSHISLVAVPVARDNGSMERDFWYATKRHLRHLPDPEAIGREAARRALRRLGARRVATCEVPVVFEAEAAASLLRHLAQAVTGTSVYRGTSFLAGRLGERIASPLVRVVDDGRIPGALGSKPFDGEGLPTRRTVVVEDGILRSYLLDGYAARRLGLASTGNASRPVGGSPAPAPTNFFLEPGAVSAQEIIRSLSRGFYVTELIGFGVNLTSGDYSRGAVGHWIENGELAYPVHEVTIAGRLPEMLQAIEAVGNDLELRRSVAAPTLLIGKMTVAGK